MAESAEVGTKLVMAISPCFIDDVFRPTGTTFEVAADIPMGRAFRDLPEDAREREDMRVKAITMPQRPEFELLNNAKRAKAAHMREQGFGDTVVTPNILPAQHQQDPAPPSLAPKPKAKATAKAK